MAKIKEELPVWKKSRADDDARHSGRRRCSSTIAEAVLSMKLGLQIPYFTWPGGPAELGPKLGEIVRTAEGAGYDSIWVMDHYFQIPMIGAAEQDMLEAYTTLGFIAGQTSRVGLGTMVTGVTYRHPGLLDQASDHARRALGRPRLARHRRRLVRARAPRARRAVPAAEGALRAARGGASDRQPDVERRQQRPVRGQALQARRDAQRPAGALEAAPAHHDRRRRREEDAPPRREVRRRLQRSRDGRRRGPSQARTSCASTASAKAATTTTSRRR